MPAKLSPEDRKSFGMLVCGMGTFILAGVLFSELSRMEEEGGSRTMNGLLVMMYDFGGKWAVTGVVAAAGCLIVGTAMYQLSKNHRS